MKQSVNRLLALCLVGVLCLASSASGAGYIIGVPLGYTPGTAPLVKIDPDTGAYITLSTAGRSYNALAQDSGGNLYGGHYFVTPDDGRVSRIDPLTGSPLQTYSIYTPGAGDIRGLAFDQSDSLFAVLNRDDIHGSPTLPDDLYSIDLGSQTATLVGSLGFRAVQGFDVSPSGAFFAWDIEKGLLTVDPVTGAAADVNLSIYGTVDIQSIVFAPDGRLFGAGYQLFSIDPVTGSYAPIGPGGGPDVRGIEWVVPEPSTNLLLMGGIVMLAARARRLEGRRGQLCKL